MAAPQGTSLPVKHRLVEGSHIDITRNRVEDGRPELTLANGTTATTTAVVGIRFAPKRRQLADTACARKLPQQVAKKSGTAPIATQNKDNWDRWRTLTHVVVGTDGSRLCTLRSIPGVFVPWSVGCAPAYLSENVRLAQPRRSVSISRITRGRLKWARRNAMLARAAARTASSVMLASS